MENLPDTLSFLNLIILGGGGAAIYKFYKILEDIRDSNLNSEKLLRNNVKMMNALNSIGETLDHNMEKPPRKFDKIASTGVMKAVD